MSDHVRKRALVHIPTASFYVMVFLNVSSESRKSVSAFFSWLCSSHVQVEGVKQGVPEGCLSLEQLTASSIVSMLNCHEPACA